MRPVEMLRRNNVRILGDRERTLLLAHGFGCDQHMWRFIAPSLMQRYRIVLFDYVGSGQSELKAYDSGRYSRLEGYAEDILEICDALELDGATFVGHSVSSMIGLIAAMDEPRFFDRLIMICPSPCFLNKPPDYRGGFDARDLEGLLDLMDKNYIGWANYLALQVLATNDNEALTAELSGSFCSSDPVIARNFARATFFSDCRSLLPQVKHPSLLLQSQTDALADVAVGEYMQASMPGSELRVLPAAGHCLQMTHPEMVIHEIDRYLAREV